MAKDSEIIFPPGMEPIGEGHFAFACHPGVECFTVCCRQVDLTLYPYDIIRLKHSLGLDSELFLRRHVRLIRGDNPFFPEVKLLLSGDEPPACPFLGEDGCRVYDSRPTACRSYPLERAVGRKDASTRPEEHYFIVHHPYCLGHAEAKLCTVAGWLRSQRLLEDNAINALWVEMDTLFAGNPWKGEGTAGEKQQLAFMVCYNIDGFRRFSDQQQLVKQFALGREERRRIARDDVELLKFGWQWLKLILTGKSALGKK